MSLNFKFLILFLTISCIVSSNICSQHYQRYKNMLGETESLLEDSTESDALEFIQSLPTSDQESFKFLDFTFYTVNKSMKGSFDSIWVSFVVETSQIHPFYVIFGRELGRSFRNRVYSHVLHYSLYYICFRAMLCSTCLADSMLM